MALPATHSEEPGRLIRAGTERSGCVLEIRGRDESCSRTGPRRRAGAGTTSRSFCQEEPQTQTELQAKSCTRAHVLDQTKRLRQRPPCFRCINAHFKNIYAKKKKKQVYIQKPSPLMSHFLRLLSTLLWVLTGQSVCEWRDITGGDTVCNFKDHRVRAA